MVSLSIYCKPILFHCLIGFIVCERALTCFLDFLTKSFYLNNPQSNRFELAQKQERHRRICVNHSAT